MGRAHHRAIYFIRRHPGITVSNLDYSVHHQTKPFRVLSGLMRDGYVVQRLSANDRRQRLLPASRHSAWIKTDRSPGSRFAALQEAGLMPLQDFNEYCKVYWTTVPLPIDPA